MASAGRILIIPKGNYDASATYEMLDLVNYNGNTWICKQTSLGITPSEGDYWQMILGAGETKTVNFEPINSENHANYNGCYYTVSGRTVHVHVGIKGLTPNGVRVTVFNMPDELKPKKLVSAFGLSDSNLDTFALGYIQITGEVEVRSNTEYACLEFNYNI